MGLVLQVPGRVKRIPAGLAVATALVSATVVLGPAPAPATATGSPAPRCAELAAKEIPASAISLPTSGGRVESASLVTQVVSGRTIEYCSVRAALFPVDPSAPKHRAANRYACRLESQVDDVRRRRIQRNDSRHQPERAVRPSRSAHRPWPVDM